jgi:hypothetical protein
MHSLKVKDGQAFDPLAFRPVIQALPGLTDSEGAPVTSLVLERVEYVDPSTVKKLSDPMERALAVLEEMDQTPRNSPEARGDDPAAAKVEVRAWKAERRARKVVKQGTKGDSPGLGRVFPRHG